jgi:hypothetical protein
MKSPAFGGKGGHGLAKITTKPPALPERRDCSGLDRAGAYGPTGLGRLAAIYDGGVRNAITAAPA